jgi:hypothetical protein
MTTLKTKLAVVAASALALAATSRAADMPAGVTIGGFASGSWTHVNNGATTDPIGIDSALVSFSGVYKPVTATISLYYVPTSSIYAAAAPGDSTIHLLDVNATLDLGSGWSVQAGRFLSWMGFESFFAVNNPEISFGNTVAGFIPGYEDGARLTYAASAWSAGVALVDSAYGPSPLQGDGELRSTYGSEAFFTYTGVKDLTLWAGVSHDSSSGAKPRGETTFDVYGTYQLTKELQVNAEYTVEDNVAVRDSSTWLTMANYTFSDQWSVAARISGDRYDGGDLASVGLNDDTKYTIAPTYTVNPHFSVRAELSYLVNMGPVAESTFEGVQVIFKF